MTAASIVVSDEYTGSLNGAGSAQRFIAGPARVTKISLGPMDNNGYLVESLADGTSLLIDAANDADALIDFLRRAAPGLTTVVTTHQHGDHWVALQRVLDELGPVSLASSIDAKGIGACVDRTVEDGDAITVGDITLTIIGLRGHTPGGLALLLQTTEGTHLFSGDSLFPGGPGKTHSPAEFACLMDDLETRVFDVLSDDVAVHPGHGDDTTLGAERPHLPSWRDRGW